MNSAQKQVTLTGYEHLILLSVLRNGERAYGVSIQQELDRTARRPTTRAAIYVALRRLENRGLLESRLAEPTAERGGRAKRFYQLTTLGLAAVKAERSSLAQMWSGLEEMLER